ncbi:MAG: hypothetical protein L6R37_007846 [Teloschistes peruensis]|nr:MAG: hypothetical protein L6R37_007846 [Teloschistes peruensis]
MAEVQHPPSDMGKEPLTEAATAGKKVDFCDSWYSREITGLPEPTRQLFERYSGIPPAQVIEHLEQMRSRAFAIYPYPCIGQLRWLNLSLSHHPLYPDVLARLCQSAKEGMNQYQSLGIDGQKSGRYYSLSHPQKFLDLGCCLAQDVRKLAFDGAPSENLYGLDIEEGFVNLSYEVFRDRDNLKSQFVVEDMLAEGEKSASDRPERSTDAISAAPLVPLSSLEKQISVIAANSFFHLYNYSDQLKLAKRVVQLLSPEPGSMILGRQVGSSVPGEYTAVNNKGTRYSHDVESFRRFWDRVAEEVGNGCRFRVEATIDEEELGNNKSQGQNWSEPNIRRIRFGVWRE